MCTGNHGFTSMTSVGLLGDLRTHTRQAMRSADLSGMTPALLLKVWECSFGSWPPHHIPVLQEHSFLITRVFWPITVVCHPPHSAVGFVSTKPCSGLHLGLLFSMG